MNEKSWIVEVGDELYGPFHGLQGANLFCDQFQARGSIKIRLLNPVDGPPSYRFQAGERVDAD